MSTMTNVNPEWKKEFSMDRMFTPTPRQSWVFEVIVKWGQIQSNKNDIFNMWTPSLFSPSLTDPHYFLKQVQFITGMVKHEKKGICFTSYLHIKAEVCNL